MAVIIERSARVLTHAHARLIHRESNGESIHHLGGEIRVLDFGIRAPPSTAGSTP